MVAGDLKSASNRVPIGKIYFELSDMGILSLENPFAERIIF